MTLDDAAIERLVAEAQAGDAWAFGSLFDHYHLPIYRYIASRVHRPSDAEDLTQLVFVKALEALPRYEARGIPFGGWLFRLARNTVIDHVRTRREHVDLDAAAVHAGTDAGPDEVTVARQELDEVAVALATLTDEQRDAIALRFFAGLSAREAAEVMGKQEGTVRGLQFRAIAALRRQLRIDEPDAGGGDDTRLNGGRVMDDAMIDLMAGDAELRRRLMAFADERLTPDLAASSRMRARVLATAHRRADLARADARLAVLSRPADAITIEDGVTPARLRATRPCPTSPDRGRDPRRGPRPVRGRGDRARRPGRWRALSRPRPARDPDAAGRCRRPGGRRGAPPPGPA